MGATDTSSLKRPDDALWHRLSRFPIGPTDTALSFATRLARENGWKPDYAERVIGEYRRFCYLAVGAGHEVTPSDAVDQAWHLHLTYTRDYWERFCPEALGAPLHHGPTAGGTAERDRFHAQYAQTLKSYERAFGPAPSDIWPSAAQRLLVDPRARRVHPRDAFILPRRVATAAAAILLIMAAALLGSLIA